MSKREPVLFKAIPKCDGNLAILPVIPTNMLQALTHCEGHLISSLTACGSSR